MVGKPLTRELAAAIEAHSLKGRVFSVAAVRDDDLVAAYSRAALLFFPSLVEGFGWPVLEAMACGCRVVTSNRLPMSEVGGSVASFVDPANPRDAAAVLESVLGEPASERERRLHDGVARAAGFNSRAMAREYLSIYTDAVARRRRAA